MTLRRILAFLGFLVAAAFTALAVKTLYDIKTGVVVIGGGHGDASPPPGVPMSPAAPMSRPSAKDIPSVLGSPLSLPRPSGGYTNETLHDFVEKDMKRMGISKVLPRGSMDSGFGGYLAEHAQGPLTREEARTLWVRYQNELSGGPAPKGVVPVGGRTVSLIPGREEGGGGRMPPARFQEGDSWSGLYATGLKPGGRTIQNAKDWAALWAHLSSRPAPEVDFSRLEAVCYFAGLRPRGAPALRIASVSESPEALVVRYEFVSRSSGADSAEAASPFALKIIAKSSLPARFERVYAGR